MTRTPRDHAVNAGGDPEVLSAKAALREESWQAIVDAVPPADGKVVFMAVPRLAGDEPSVASRPEAR